MNDPAYATNSSKNAAAGANQDLDHCRICRSEATPQEPLFHPCKCSGSIKFVHQDWFVPDTLKYPLPLC
jgi:E3 ubiquitin-protein ligase MARCH6